MDTELLAQLDSSQVFSLYFWVYTMELLVVTKNWKRGNCASAGGETDTLSCTHVWDTVLKVVNKYSKINQKKLLTHNNTEE